VYYQVFSSGKAMLAERLILCFTSADQWVGLVRADLAWWVFSLE
jgi:hypothetical protein